MKITILKSDNVHHLQMYESMLISDTYDLSIGFTETKYIKLNTKTQNIFCYVNENLTTFLYTLTGGDKKTEGDIFFSSFVFLSPLSKCIKK